VSRRIAVNVTLAAVLAGFLALVFRPAFYPPYFEGRTYLAMARGNYARIPGYYGGRVLHPLVARLLARIAGVPVDARVFLWLSVASLLAFFVFIGLYYRLEYSSGGRIWLFLLVTATVVDQYRNYYWHDLFYAALCALFFLVLRANVWISLPFALLLYITRESTIVLVVALVAVAAVRRRWKLCSAAAFVGLVGMKLDSALLAHALPNTQGMPVFVLDLLKIPYNFAYNICGLEIWTNTNASTLLPPVWTAPVPVWLHLGHIREIGYCGFFWQNPASTFLALAAAFGVLPLALVRVAKARDWQVPWPERIDLATALLFGGLMFLLAPLTGTIPARYVLYGWPLFWLFGVAVLHRAYPASRKRAYIILFSLCISWTPAAVRLVLGPSIGGAQSISTLTTPGLILSIVVIVVLNAISWRFLAVDSPQASLVPGFSEPMSLSHKPD